MGNIAHLRKRLKSITQIIISSFEQTCISLIQGCIVPGLVEISPAVLEKICKFCKCIFRYFLIISHLEKVGPFI